MTEKNYFEFFERMPRPKYPYPDIDNPLREALVQEYYNWIDEDYSFHSEEARTKHKQHRITDIAARGMPFLNTLQELRPLARYASTGAMMDDYFDRVTYEEMYSIRERVVALLTGEDDKKPTDLGIYNQFYMIRQDAITCKIPEHLYNKYVTSMNNVLVGYQHEKKYVAANIPPPLPVYAILREQTSGGLPFARYVCLQKNFRELPDEIIEHPFMVRLYALSARLIGYHNDLISLPKELNRKGDVINIVMVMRHEHNVSLEEAYMLALDFHDKDVQEFVTLHENLPDFGIWQDMVYDYVQALGIMVQGVYAWHIKDCIRYNTKGSYVEPEFNSPNFKWES